METAYMYTGLAQVRKIAEHRLVKELAIYVLSAIVCFLLLVWVLQLWEADLGVSFSYYGDSLSGSVDIKGTIDNGWYLENKFIGAPTGLQKYDFPAPEALHYLWVKLISLFTHNYANVMNIYFLLTFLLTMFTSLFVMRQFGISFAPAIFVSILYAFLPYHFLRKDHLFLASYYVVPLGILVMLWVGFSKPLFFNPEKGAGLRLHLNTKTTLSIIICLLIASTGIYYAFFTVVLLLVCGLWVCLNKKNLKHFLVAIILVAVIVIGVFANLFPSILYTYKNGPNKMAAGRGWYEAEIYGLKISQLLLPVNGHRISGFAAKKTQYNNKAPLVTENETASLGIVGAAGFFILIAWLFLRERFFLSSVFSENKLQIFNNLSLLNLSALLFSTIGGLGSLFAFLVSPNFRGLNRLSVFIAFFSLFAVALLLDSLFDKYNKLIWRILFLSFLGVVLILGVLDQTTGKMIPPYDQLKAENSNDAKFVKGIEAIMPKNAMIFQLPYSPYPESPVLNRMWDYELFRGYLHSKDLRWSYGAMKGRSVDIWQKQVSAKQPRDFLKAIALKGFKGVYIDRYGFADNVAAFEKELSTILKTKPIESDNKRLLFFSLLQYHKGLGKNKSSF